MREHWDLGLMEFSLPNSRTVFFYECVTLTQYIYLRNPNAKSNRFARLPHLLDPYDDEDSYDGRMMMELSGELMTFLVGGPHF